MNRRGFMVGCAAAPMAAVPGSAAIAALADADAPFFALLAQHEALGAEYCRTDDADTEARQALFRYDAAAEAATEKYGRLLHAAENKVYADDEGMTALIKELPPIEPGEDHIMDRFKQLAAHVRAIAHGDPRVRTAAAKWQEAELEREAFYVTNVAPLEAANDSAWKAFDATEREIIAYPVRTAAGLRAKLDAIHKYEMDPHDGQKPNISPAHGVPDFAAIVLADVERVLGA